MVTTFVFKSSKKVFFFIECEGLPFFVSILISSCLSASAISSISISFIELSSIISSLPLELSLSRIA